MVKLNSSVVNLSSDRKDLQMRWLIGNSVVGVIDGETYLFQNVNGHQLIPFSDLSEGPLKQMVEGAEKAVKGKAHVFAAEDVYHRIWREMSYHYQASTYTHVTEEREVEIDDPKGRKEWHFPWNWTVKKVKVKRQVPVAKNYAISFDIHPYQGGYHQPCHQAVDQVIRERVATSQRLTNQFVEGNDAYRENLVEQLLAGGIQWKLFERAAEDESDVVPAFDTAELWQATLIQAVLSQQEQADKLNKRFKASLEWPGKFQDRVKGEYYLEGETLEDLITKYAHTRVDG